MRRVLVPTAYLVLGGAALALLVLNVIVWSGGLIDDPASEPASGTQQSAPEPQPPPPPEPQPVIRPQSPRHKAAAATSLTISATRGDCWVEVRAGSSVGEVLYAGTLAGGKTLRFNRDKLWLRLGAASNVDVLVNGRPSAVPPGTVELLVPT